MSSFGGSSNDAEDLIEDSLPVELQTKNVLSPAYAITTVTNPATNGPVKGSHVVGYNGTVAREPYVEIVEQPQQRGFRFRYECEGPSHGGLQGTKSERSKKTYPSIKIHNYSGAARVVVSLVTDEKTPRSHAHKLVGTDCKDGLCIVEIKVNTDAIHFANLCILHVTRKKLGDVLTERILDSIKLNKKLAANNMNFDPPITEEDRRTARQQAEEQSKTMQLNVVRLCFQVFLRNADGSFSRMLTPVVSQPIYDSKSPGASALKICRMDKYGGCCSGNEEVFLLCEKVQKDDIQVRFVEQNPDGSVKWEAYGNFGPLDVHRQYAIVFKTPAYWNTNIDKAVNVLIMLQRKSDQEVSEPKAFTYFPQNRDKDNIASKKRKRIPLDGYDFGGDGGMGGAGMGGEGGGGGMGPAGGSGHIDGGGTGGSNGTNGSFLVVMPQSGMMNHRTTLPTTLEEDEHQEYGPNYGLLDSERLLQTLNMEVISPVSSDDPWLNQDDDDSIEVDSAVTPPADKAGPVPEHPDNKTQRMRIGPVSPSHPSSRFHGPSVGPNNSKIGQDGGRNDKSKTSSESSLDWLESCVDSGNGKSIVSIEEKKMPFILRDSSRHSRSEGGSEDKDDKDETKTSKSSSASDYHSEGDGKLEVTSEGVRSDEGFSETSEEIALKGQQQSPSKLKPGGQLEKTITERCSKDCSQLTETVRKVTCHVAERTLAALTDYSETGDIRHLLLVQRHLMAVSNKNGDLPLHLAVINSQPEALKSLVDVMCTLPESKKLINSFNTLRQTPLHLAAVMQQNKMVEILLQAGADPTIADSNGNTAAHLAVLNNSDTCLKTLVKYLRPGQSQDDPFPELNYLNYDGYSPVQLAAQTGSVDMLQTLVFGKADVDLPDGKSGKTALHHAVENDDLPVAGYLLMEANTDVNARCFDGNTALHIACARQLVGMVALLVTAGADMECENEEIPDPEAGTDEMGGIDRRGLKPVDYADDNEQILRILYGETDGENTNGWASSDDLVSKMSQLSVGKTLSVGKEYRTVTRNASHDSGVESLRISSGISDLSELSSKTRMELSRRLDSSQLGRDVWALAEKLGYSYLVNTFKESGIKDTSPTAFLLEYYESHDGSVSKLRDALRAIGREDAATLIPFDH